MRSPFLSKRTHPPSFLPKTTILSFELPEHYKRGQCKSPSAAETYQTLQISLCSYKESYSPEYFKPFPHHHLPCKQNNLFNFIPLFMLKDYISCQQYLLIFNFNMYDLIISAIVRGSICKE